MRRFTFAFDLGLTHTVVLGSVLAGFLGEHGEERGSYSMPHFTAPKGTAEPGKTFPPLYAVPGTVPEVPMKGST